MSTLYKIMQKAPTSAMIIRCCIERVAALDADVKKRERCGISIGALRSCPETGPISIYVMSMEMRARRRRTVKKKN